MLVKTYCAAVNGLEVTTVTIEVSLNRGVQYHLTGLGDEAVRESRDRIAAALQYSGFKFPVADITINMAPADLRKEGSSFDLPLAIGILGANSNIIEDHLKEYMMVGELSLDGTLQPIRGALPIAIRARAEHFKGLIVPRTERARGCRGQQLRGVRHEKPARGHPVHERPEQSFSHHRRYPQGILREPESFRPRLC